jgi:hypothetical protein
MSTPQPEANAATETSDVAAVPMRFEVTTLPVADVDRTKARPSTSVSAGGSTSTSSPRPASAECS